MISAESSSHPPLYQSRHSLRGAMAVQALQQLLRRDSCRLGAQMDLAPSMSAKGSLADL